MQDHLPADRDLHNTCRQVEHAGYSLVSPQIPSTPKLRAYTSDLAESLGLDDRYCRSEEFLNVVSAGRYSLGQPKGELANSKIASYAMCYGGHQFGNWAGQLGDGRAINLGEVIDLHGQYQTIQLKGAGPTPYSRFADGFAVLRSSIREFLCSEAMHHLGVPTTRALSLITSGNDVERDMFYSGNQIPEPGAIVARVAPSFLRFGNFEIFAARGDIQTLEQLAAYCVQFDFPELWPLYQNDKREALLKMFSIVCERTVTAVVHWMRLGFVHGVLNTDNMSITGLTIDYGPYGWLDNFDPSWTPNTTDAQNRRYRYENQPAVAQWNLLQLANALYPLIQDAEGLESIVKNFKPQYESAWHLMMAGKLGLAPSGVVPEGFYTRLESLMGRSQIDMTNFYRALSIFVGSYVNEKAFDVIVLGNSYLDNIPPSLVSEWKVFFTELQGLVGMSKQNPTDRQKAMCRVNPCFILRNFVVQQAIDAAYEGNDELIKTLQLAIVHPYEPHESHTAFDTMRPKWALNKAGCSMLSCSS